VSSAAACGRERELRLGVRAGAASSATACGWEHELRRERASFAGVLRHARASSDRADLHRHHTRANRGQVSFAPQLHRCRVRATFAGVLRRLCVLAGGRRRRRNRCNGGGAVMDGGDEWSFGGGEWSSGEAQTGP